MPATHALILTPDGSCTRLDRAPDLKESQRLVCGYIELLGSDTHPNLQLVVNEGGKMLFLQESAWTPTLRRLGFWHAPFPVCGTVIVQCGDESVMSAEDVCLFKAKSE
jgi:hypothetical protein